MILADFCPAFVLQTPTGSPRNRLEHLNKNSTTNTLKQEFTLMADYIVLETSLGEVELELYRNHAPKTVENFVQLASQGYYNQTIFHR